MRMAAPVPRARGHHDGPAADDLVGPPLGSPRQHGRATLIRGKRGGARCRTPSSRHPAVASVGRARSHSTLTWNQPYHSPLTCYHMCTFHGHGWNIGHD